LVVNASTESRSVAAALVRQGLPAVCVVPPDAPAVFHHESVRFVACPASRRGTGGRKIQCISCGGRFGLPLCAQADRPSDDSFASQLGAVSGAVDLRFVGGEGRPDHQLGHFDDWARLGVAGHFSGLRSASAVADVLSTVLATQVRVVENVGRWRDIPSESRTRIGATGSDNQLGLGATLGRRFFATEWDVRLVLAARNMASLIDLLPGGDSHRVLAECARAILPQHIEWTARIEIDEAEIVPARLHRGSGGARLGQTAWIAPHGRKGHKRDELRLHTAA
jgi:type VI secretion system protein ImpH